VAKISLICESVIKIYNQIYDLLIRQRIFPRSTPYNAEEIVFYIFSSIIMNKTLVTYARLEFALSETNVKAPSAIGSDSVIQFYLWEQADSSLIGNLATGRITEVRIP
jgi:hypothetical protein